MFSVDRILGSNFGGCAREVNESEESGKNFVQLVRPEYYSSMVVKVLPLKHD